MIETIFCTVDLMISAVSMEIFFENLDVTAKKGGSGFCWYFCPIKVKELLYA